MADGCFATPIISQGQPVVREFVSCGTVYTHETATFQIFPNKGWAQFRKIYVHSFESYPPPAGHVRLGQVAAGRQTEPPLEQIFRHRSAHDLAFTEDRLQVHKHPDGAGTESISYFRPPTVHGARPGWPTAAPALPAQCVGVGCVGLPAMPAAREPTVFAD